jgi:predicted nucleic acid-binding protein
MAPPGEPTAQPAAGPPQGGLAPPGGSDPRSGGAWGLYVVLDTNIVLDLFVFNDPAAEPVLAALQQGTLRWIATQPQMEPVAAKASVTCKDADDQKFIDLAVVHSAHLLSKDNAVLCMAKRLLALGVLAQAAMK